MDPAGSAPCGKGRRLGIGSAAQPNPLLYGGCCGLVSLIISVVLLLYTLAGRVPSVRMAANHQVIIGAVIFGVAAAWN